MNAVRDSGLGTYQKLEKQPEGDKGAEEKKPEKAEITEEDKV
ncbi:hypothetical protein Pint_09771 [Pistacia integerrima]|uniref:Uncharacterized protein n=2 Tax=Pistacia TaxID=55512 RepID=A0ACC1A3Y5_9ROSI|nr:hypothetical protein Pint_09771 [Pistacia integerrima]KAJ0081083.1 hypothetical protein Patl1_10716 [Pistacia atlantica]